MQIVRSANFHNAGPTAFQAYNQFAFHWEKMNTETAITCHNDLPPRNDLVEVPLQLKMDFSNVVGHSSCVR